MNIKTTISITEARKRIFDIAEEVQIPNRVYTLTSGGKPKAVIMSAEEYESMVETIEVEKIFPDLDKDIKETKRAFKTGEYKKWPTLGDLKKDWGFAAAEKPKKKYGIRSGNKTKGKKRS
ncbi:type II toxin-antitoxin system Phd/YefM family antitoxin [Patescibacteria group bacterium]|nr:type II toxin-antitoxin system Phd/YefM family antitoxin [Patescibacteria group bacterium]MBU4454928.1 type II toxin-antitoxin system Phd/YefM family antitoxin [Patescibacteria group bacterium]MDP3043759.1 type II toxin-antitoxin system Phd/YefM family antitoxin [bacterium]